MSQLAGRSCPLAYRHGAEALARLPAGVVVARVAHHRREEVRVAQAAVQRRAADLEAAE